LQTLHIAYAADRPLDRTLPGDVFPEGHEGLSGHSPMEVIRDIAQSGKLNGRRVRGAWVLRDQPHGAAPYVAAAVFGLVPIAVEEQCTADTKQYGRAGPD
jgi:hypothetical protein